MRAFAKPGEITMRDDTLVEQFAVPEILVDGFAEHVSINGVMRCVGYRNVGNRKVIVIRLAWPEASTEAAIGEALDALSIAPLTAPRSTKRRVH